MEEYGFPPPANNAPKQSYPVGVKELVLFLFSIVTGLLLCNGILYGGFNLAFTIFSALALIGAVSYLLISGCRPTFYSVALLLLSLGLLIGFSRSNDGFVKFVLLNFLFVSENLGLCLLAGQNRRLTGGAASLLDAPRTLFMLGMGKLPPACRGLRDAFRRSGSAGKKGFAILIGVLVSVPILAILIPLLISADAAFDSLIQLLPDWNFGEVIVTVIFGTFPALVLYIRAVALQSAEKKPMAEAKSWKGVSALTINTVLISVAVVYCIYLLSQIAYFSGGFMGILPDGYTTAEYARRGFFEMAWLCAINLIVMILAIGLVTKTEKSPLLTRLLCLFVGLVTLFLVSTASAKMFLYIDTYGLTRLRVLTEVIMFWFALTTFVISLWLFIPKLPYMKVILLLSLLIGGTVLWADVDTVVARYNVTAYQSGKLDNVDVDYLICLDNNAIPYIELLTQDSNPEIAEAATAFMERKNTNLREIDFRNWNYVNHTAKKYITPPTDSEIPE